MYSSMKMYTIFSASTYPWCYVENVFVFINRERIYGVVVQALRGRDETRRFSFPMYILNGVIPAVERI